MSADEQKIKDLENYNEKIIDAIHSNDSKKLKKSLKQIKSKNIDINACMITDNYLEEAYDYDASNDIFELLLKHQPAPSKNLKDANAVMYRVALRADLELFKLFIKHAADVNIHGINEHETNLEGVYNTENYEQALEEHETGSNDNKEIYSIEKPLICAVLEGWGYGQAEKNIAAALLKSKNLELLNRDELKDNAFSYAVAYADVKMLKKLIKKDKRVIERSENLNKNLISIAVHNEQYANLKFLLKSKIKVNDISHVSKKDGLFCLLEKHNNYVEELNEKYTDKKAIQNDKKYINLKKIYNLLIKNGAQLSNLHIDELKKAKKIKHSFISKKTIKHELEK